MFAGCLSARTFAGLGDEVVDEAGGRARLPGAPAFAGRGGTPRRCGSVSAMSLGKALAAQDEEEAVLADRAGRRLRRPGGRCCDRVFAEGGAGVGADAPGAAVGDEALVVDGAEVAAGGQVFATKVEVDAEGFEDAAADAVLQRVVAEEGEMAGAAAGRDAVADGHGEAADAVGGEAVEVDGVRLFELGAAGLGIGQAAEAVDDEEDDFGVVLDDEFADDFEVHAYSLECGQD